MRMWQCVCVLVMTSCVLQAFGAEPCDTPDHRAFDFWIGAWDVHTPDGKLAGRNIIEKKNDGCVLHEQYTTPRGFNGQSLNAFDVSRGVWHQTWVDSSGTLLLLEGGLKDGRMVLEGRTRDQDGTTVQHRITWTPHPDGTVRQYWESTKGNGEWTVVFDGKYSKK